MKVLRLLVLTGIALMLVACGGGGSSNDTGFVPNRYGIGYEIWNASTQRPDIHLARSNGSGDQLLTFPALTGAEKPSFTSDGTLVAFYKRLSDTAAGVFVMTVADGNATKIADLVTSPDMLFSCPISWRSDRGRLIYIDSYGKAIAVDVDGGNPIQLTPNSQGVTDNCARWSPDGSKIAFERQADIWVSDSAGGNQTKILGFDSVTNYAYPDWMPDSTHLVAVRNVRQIVTFKDDGTGETMLAVPNNPAGVNNIRTSPDGSMIAMGAYKVEGGPASIAIFDVATSRLFWWPRNIDNWNANWLP